MKSTRSGHKWAHVSCALWIPEVSIGDVEKMEPVTKISNISVSGAAVGRVGTRSLAVLAGTVDCSDRRASVQQTVGV